ncbi:hypothetical protein CONLIGDRAFT_638793 [Coniochaeta ligniaria NRRL 30616]|uniref:Uncharacterized protein n=1 Tax=Coniochaeta ligniaria NRRL 30616 TaxID=1408157 RepID=A0A1J7J4Y3_9PEZI|nr:hypothetical protein CONLIGDRAFT_638793 [Coniochaeta ligniaria NRRL 30616]
MKEQAWSPAGPRRGYRGCRWRPSILPNVLPDSLLLALCHVPEHALKESGAEAPYLPLHGTKHMLRRGETCRVSDRELLFALSHVPEDDLKDDLPKLLIFHCKTWSPHEGSTLRWREGTPRVNGRKAECNQGSVGPDELPYVADLILVSIKTNFP